MLIFSLVCTLTLNQFYVRTRGIERGFGGLLICYQCFCLRRGWDSNPRSACADACFQDKCTSPLCDLSKCCFPRLLLARLIRNPVSLAADSPPLWTIRSTVLRFASPVCVHSVFFASNNLEPIFRFLRSTLGQYTPINDF